MFHYISTCAFSRRKQRTYGYAGAPWTSSNIPQSSGQRCGFLFLILSQWHSYDRVDAQLLGLGSDRAAALATYYVRKRFARANDSLSFSSLWLPMFVHPRPKEVRESIKTATRALDPFKLLASDFHPALPFQTRTHI
jgi:hypothetical protein